jgi:hypothetical protein
VLQMGEGTEQTPIAILTELEGRRHIGEPSELAALTMWAVGNVVKLNLSGRPAQCPRLRTTASYT